MLSEVQVRFYEELNDSLPVEMRKHPFTYKFREDITVEILLQNLNIAPEQVELVLVNSQSVDFSFPLKNGDHVSVYPVMEALDVTSIIRVRKKPLRQTLFMAGPGLRRLTAYLRLCGFDTQVSDSGNIQETIISSEQNRRILLTRDTALLRNPSITRIHLVKENKPRYQLAAILQRYDLHEMLNLFSRCLFCNHLGGWTDTGICVECGRNYPGRFHRQRLQFLVRHIKKSVSG